MPRRTRGETGVRAEAVGDPPIRCPQVDGLHPGLAIPRWDRPRHRHRPPARFSSKRRQRSAAWTGRECRRNLPRRSVGNRRGGGRRQRPKAVRVAGHGDDHRPVSTPAGETRRRNGERRIAGPDDGLRLWAGWQVGSPPGRSRGRHAAGAVQRSPAVVRHATRQLPPLRGGGRNCTVTMGLRLPLIRRRGRPGRRIGEWLRGNDTTADEHDQGKRRGRKADFGATRHHPCIHPFYSLCAHRADVGPRCFQRVAGARPG